MGPEFSKLVYFDPPNSENWDYIICVTEITEPQNVRFCILL